MNDLIALSWPIADLGDAIEALARQSGLSPRSVKVTNPPGSFAGSSSERLSRWIEETAAWIGVEAEQVVCPYSEADKFVRRAAPAIVRLPLKGEERFLLIAGGNRNTVSILAPDLRTHKIASSLLSSFLCSGIEAPALDAVNRLLEDVGVAKRHQARARAAILRQQIGHVWIRDCWMLRLHPGAKRSRSGATGKARGPAFTHRACLHASILARHSCVVGLRARGV